MPIRIYQSPQIGDGLSPMTAFRSRLHQHIDITQGDHFDEIDNPLTRTSISTVWATQAAHDRIALDPKIIPLSDLWVDDANKKDKLKKLKKDKTGKDVIPQDEIKKLLAKNLTAQRIAGNGPTEDWVKKPIKFAGEDF